MTHAHLAQGILALGLTCMLGGATIAPASAAEPKAIQKFRFVAFGDYQGGAQITGATPGTDKIIDALKEPSLNPIPSFYVNTGDIATLDVFPNKTFPLAPLYAARGNNDDLIWATLCPGCKGKNYYAKTHGNSLFVFLDSSPNSDETQKLFPPPSAKPNCAKPAHQIDFLVCNLAAANKNTLIENIFVILHVPPLAYGAYNGSVYELNRLEPILSNQPKLRAVLSGHNHFYQRLARNGITYLVIGGGGANLYDPTTSKPLPKDIKTQAKSFHYTVFDVDGSSVKLKVIGYSPKTNLFTPIETVALSCQQGAKRKVACSGGTRTETCQLGQWVPGPCLKSCPAGLVCCDLAESGKCLKCAKVCP